MQKYLKEKNSLYYLFLFSIIRNIKEELKVYYIVSLNTPVQPYEYSSPSSTICVTTLKPYNYKTRSQWKLLYHIFVGNDHRGETQNIQNKSNTLVSPSFLYESFHVLFIHCWER